MPDDTKVALRPGSWDPLIVESVMRGEYGPLDVRDRIVVDVGAHIGAFSVLAAKRGARRVLAFEPGDENGRLLAINAAPWPAIEVHRAAVWRSDESEGVLRWRASTNARNTGGGTVVASRAIAGVPVDQREAHEVAAIPLDAILEGAGHVGLLKIDAEGSEYPILATSRRLDRVDAIVGEWHEVDGLDATMALPGLDAWTGEALMDLLDDRGFDVETREAGGGGVFRATRRARS